MLFIVNNLFLINYNYTTNPEHKENYEEISHIIMSVTIKQTYKYWDMIYVNVDISNTEEYCQLMCYSIMYIIRSAHIIKSHQTI